MDGWRSALSFFAGLSPSFGMQYFSLSESPSLCSLDLKKLLALEQPVLMLER